MSDWQERITADTAPAIQAEHELRYRLAAPLVARAGTWADLGCGNGLGATSGLRIADVAPERPGRGTAGPEGSEARRADATTEHALPEQILLVDLDAKAAERARAALAAPHARTCQADLTDRAALEHIGRILLDLPGERIVTCFEVIEHLPTFVPLLAWMSELASAEQATFVLSVPNDAFWALQNPYHQSSWGEAAFDELRRLLPQPSVLLCQVPLSGSAIAAWEDSTGCEHTLTVSAGGSAAIATHFVAAFGPHRDELWSGAVVVQADLLAQRHWERQREANLAFAEHTVEEHKAALAAQESTMAEQREALRANSAAMAAAREYIHELERELGRPLAGSPEALALAAEQAERAGPPS